MKQINVREAKSGMKLARPVMFKGSVLLDIGTILSDEYIRSLNKRNILFVYIEDKNDDNIDDIVKIDPESLSDEYINRLKNLSFSKKNTEELINIIKELGNLLSPKSIPELMKLLLTIPNELEDIKSCVLDSLNKFPHESLDCSKLVTFITTEKSEKIHSKVFEIIETGASESIIDIFFSGINKYSIKDIQKISDTCLQFDSDTVIDHAIKAIMSSDEKSKRLLMKILENFVSAEQYTEYAKTYLGISINPQSAIKKETIRQTEKASEKFSSEAVTNISIESAEELESIDAEEVFKVKLDDVIKPSVKEIIKFTDKDRKNIKTVFKKIYNETISDTENILVDLRAGKRIVEGKIEEMVSKMLIQVKENKESAFELIANNTLNNYMLSHSLNSTYISLLLGLLSGLEDDELMILGISSLLHDVGMVKMKNLSWNEPRALDELEMLDIKKHTIFGIDSLTSSTRFPKEVGYVAYQHHERMDGSGYPKGRKKNLISKFSQIIMIADVFTAMISTRRYRKKYSMEATLYYLSVEAEEKFNQKFVNSLIKYIEQYIEPEILQKMKEVKNNISNEENDDVISKKVMVIDDNKQITDLVNNCLAGIYETIIFNEPLKALDDIKSISPDIVIIDLFMPKMDGFGVCETIRNTEELKKLPIIILTVKKDKKTVLTAMKYNVSGYLTKPFKKNELVSKIQSVLFS